MLFTTEGFSLGSFIFLNAAHNNSERSDSKPCLPRTTEPSRDTSQQHKHGCRNGAGRAARRPGAPWRPPEQAWASPQSWTLQPVAGHSAQLHSTKRQIKTNHSYTGLDVATQPGPCPTEDRPPCMSCPQCISLSTHLSFLARASIKYRLYV